MEAEHGDPGGPFGPSGDAPLEDITTEADELDLAALAAEVDGGAAAAPRRGDQSAEEAVAEAVDLAQRLENERDELRELAQRIQAEFENYRRRVDAQRDEFRAHAAADLVRELLPVLDACDAAVAQGHDDVVPVQTQLIQTLEKRGLARVDADEVAFDPNVHEAVLHEEGEGGDDGPVVVEVMRAGYLWNERVVRPAMVKVRG